MKMNAPTSVLFLWHMHQPLYKKPKDKLYLLPWVRLHGVKDYFGFVYHLSKFSKIKANFNFSPVLLDQIIDYVSNGATDVYLELTKKNPSYLSFKERSFIIKRFFSVNKSTLIETYPRYFQLYEASLSKKPKYFTDQEIRDIQVYFNLTWFHPLTVREDNNLTEIFRKAKEFDEDDKVYIINKQYQVLSQIIPLYKRLLDEGKIEISLSPYYHPILPLLCDTEVLKKHNQTPPGARFSYPQEAFWQISQAKKKGESLFNTQIEGSWPSEGAVSESVVSLYKEVGFSWIATDEEILFRTLREKEPFTIPRHIIYQPYFFRDMLIFFRDKGLSDLISFVYHSWEDQKCASLDLLAHLRNIHDFVSSIYKKRMVLIVMDGENAWEYYKMNAWDFLESLYQGLEESPQLKSETISSFIKDAGSFKMIKKELWPGSWINADFSVWAGSQENNHNWEILSKVKKCIDREKARLSPREVEKLYYYLRIIEGSDWNWWNTYKDSTGDFKKIFSSYVKEISRLLNINILY